MIRVLQVFSKLNRGGAETMVMNIYRTIDRTKVQFDFIVNCEGEHDYSEEIRSLGGKIYYLPKFNGLNYFSLKKKWRKFFIEHPEYKILHSHVRSYASIYIPIAKKYGLKTIIHSHSTSNGKGIGAVIKKIMQYPLRFQADYLFACSQISGEWLFGKKATKKDNYKLIPNAVDLDKFKFDSKVREVYRKSLGIENNTVYIHVGRFHPAKNHLFLLNLFSGIRRTNDNAVLLLVGDGELRTDIENKIKKLQIDNGVKLLGSRDDVYKLLQAADCFLFPSKWEGLPVTVIEAQVAGLPCFVSENVTSEVFISEYAYKLPVNKGTDVWLNAIAKTDKERHDFIKEVGETQFDINSSVNCLTDFYINLCKK